MKRFDKELEIINVILKEGGITAAAKKLFISQPALSQKIALLEKELGITIFRRDVSPMKLTYEGVLYLKTLQEIQEIGCNFKKQIEEIANSNYGCVSLALSSMRAQQFLPKLLPLLKKELPNLELSLIHCSTRAALDEILLDKNVDFCINSAINPHVIQQELASPEYLLTVPASHPLAKAYPNQKHWKQKPAVPLDMIADDLFILNYKEQGGRITAEQIFNMLHFKPRKILEVFDYYTIAQLVHQEIGIAVLPSTNIAYFYDQLNVSFFRFSVSPSYPIYLSYRKNLHITKIMQAFIDLCKSPDLWLPPLY